MNSTPRWFLWNLTMHGRSLKAKDKKLFTETFPYRASAEVPHPAAVYDTIGQPLLLRTEWDDGQVNIRTPFAVLLYLLHPAPYPAHFSIRLRSVTEWVSVCSDVCTWSLMNQLIRELLRELRHSHMFSTELELTSFFSLTAVFFLFVLFVLS